MKTILTILFVLTIGVTAQAQDAKVDVKVETIEKTIVTSTTNENTVARLYKFKNSRVKESIVFYYEKKQS